MAKANKKTATTTETPATVSNIPPTTAAAHDATVRRAERAFLAAVEAGNDGATERATWQAAKAARNEFMAHRLPIACRGFIAVHEDTNSTPEQKAAAITELRSALAGMANPVVASKGATEAAA